MLPKLVDRSIGKYLLYLAIFSIVVPSSSAIADTSTGSLSVGVQVLAKCNTPVTSSAGLSERENINQHLKIKCSARTKPAVVRVVPMAVNTANPTKSKSKTVKILVGY
jgi:hypothetical protein